MTTERETDVTWIRPAVLMAFILAVAGCGGGSGSLRSETAARQVPLAIEADAKPEASTESTMSEVETATEEDALAEERRQAERAITRAEAEAARKQAAADMAAQEARIATRAENPSQIDSFYVHYVSADTHAEFNGGDVRVHLPDYFHGYPVLSSVLDEGDSMAVPSRVAGYSQRTWTLSDDGPLAVVSVRWNDRDNSDHLAGG